jgi:hypothetical protein
MGLHGVKQGVLGERIFCFSRSRSDHTPVGFASAEAGVTIHLLVLLQPKQR